MLSAPADACAEADGVAVVVKLLPLNGRNQQQRNRTVNSSIITMWNLGDGTKAWLQILWDDTGGVKKNTQYFFYCVWNMYSLGLLDQIVLLYAGSRLGLLSMPIIYMIQVLAVV